MSPVLQNMNAWGNGHRYFGVFFWHMDFPQWIKVKYSPHLILRKSCPHLIICCIDIAGCGFLIKLHIYMMSKIIYCAWISTIKCRHQPWSPIQKTSINGMALALRLLPWFHTIFSYIYLMQNGVKTGVLHSPPPSIALSLVLYKIEQKCDTSIALSAL